MLGLIMKTKQILLFLLISVSLSSCFRRWFLSDKQIVEHYKNKQAKPQKHFIENDSIKLHYVTFGKETNRPVIFIHGAPGSWDGYLNLLDDSLLQQKFNLISVDRLGYGTSKVKPKKKIYSLEAQAVAIMQTLRDNKSGMKPIILGRSYGAPIAVKMAAMYADKIEKIILVSPAIDPDTEKFWWFSGLGKFFLVRWFLPTRMNTATDEKFAHVAELRRLVPEWKKISTNVTVLTGGKDWIVDTTNFSYAKKMLVGKNAKFVFVPESGHLITASHPQIMVKEMIETDSLARK